MKQDLPLVMRNFSCMTLVYTWAQLVCIDTCELSAPCAVADCCLYCTNIQDCHICGRNYRSIYKHCSIMAAVVCNGQEKATVKVAMIHTHTKVHHDCDTAR
eukprot:16142-Heterococcus_DN1.PRE.5